MITIIISVSATVEIFVFYCTSLYSHVQCKELFVELRLKHEEEEKYQEQIQTKRKTKQKYDMFIFLIQHM